MPASSTIDFSHQNFIRTCETNVHNEYDQHADAVNATDTQYSYTLADTDTIEYCFSTIQSLTGILVMIGVFLACVVLVINLVNRRGKWFVKK